MPQTCSEGLDGAKSYSTASVRSGSKSPNTFVSHLRPAIECTQGMSAAPLGSHILYCVGLKGNFGGDLSSCVAFRSKAKTAPLDEAAVATVTVPQSPVGLQMPFSCPPSALVHEELAGSVFSTIGTLLFFFFLVQF